MPTKIALSGVQTLLTLLTTQLAFDSADLRFRKALLHKSTLKSKPSL